MWFTERTGIGRITSAGTVTNFRIQSNGRPNDIIRGPDGALWFTTNTQVGRITTAGHFTAWSIPGAKSLSGIVAAPGGGFWLADEQASTIRRFTPARNESQPASHRQDSAPHAGSQPPPRANSSCPSAPAVRHVLETQVYWRNTAFTLSPDVTCIGPYVVATASNSSGSGARILLKQQATGLRYLVAGSGPICTIVRSNAEPGQLVYIPPQYGHALLCLKRNGVA
jgi:hypothetical protein